MKMAIVPSTMMVEQLSLWKYEREVQEAEQRLDTCVERTARARRTLMDKQQQLFDSKTRIDAARANINVILKR